jgi:2,3-bisphosphoglycerate-dependent phosphoglycerate mutase
MAKLVLVRHGKSVWNLENRFTGWVDVDLSEKGIEEAIEAGKRLKKGGIKFDVAFSSMLKRAIKTGFYILEELDMLHINHLKDWRFNERHYGELTGMNKDEVKKKIGEEQFLIYRRSYDTPPPPLSTESKWHPIYDEKYKNIDPALLPSTESLKDNQKRAMAAFHEYVAPLLVEGKNVLITAHGNTIRGMVKELDNISDENISKFEIQTGIPRVYQFDEALHIQKVYNITE